MLLLGIDTSGAVSAAVHDGDALRAVESVHDPRRHAELLAPMVVSVLARAGATRQEVTGVAVGVGPGPFTGLRVGLVTARTLGLVLGVTVHGVCSLDALAAAAGLDGDHLVATDARRREVYWARYAGGVRVDGPHVDRPGDVPVDGLPVVGRGAALYPDLLPGAPVDPGAPLDADAGAVAGVAARTLRAGRSLLPPDPLYLRRPDAAEPAARKPALPSPP